MLFVVGTAGKGATQSSARRRSRLLAIEVAPAVGVVAFAALAVAAVVGPTTAQLSASPGTLGRGLPDLGALNRSAARELDAGGAPGEASVMVARPRASGRRSGLAAGSPASPGSSTSLVSFLDGRGRPSSAGVPLGRVRASVPSADAPSVAAPAVAVEPAIPVTVTVDPAPTLVAAPAPAPVAPTAAAPKPRARGAKQATTASTVTLSAQSATSTSTSTSRSTSGKEADRPGKADGHDTADARSAGPSEKGRQAAPRR